MENSRSQWSETNVHVDFQWVSNGNIDWHLTAAFGEKWNYSFWKTHLLDTSVAGTLHKEANRTFPSSPKLSFTHNGNSPLALEQHLGNSVELQHVRGCDCFIGRDYSFRWKMLHYYAKKFFSPVLISTFEEEGIWKLNTQKKRFVDCLHQQWSYWKDLRRFPNWALVLEWEDDHIVEPDDGSPSDVQPPSAPQEHQRGSWLLRTEPMFPLDSSIWRIWKRIVHQHPFPFFIPTSEIGRYWNCCLECSVHWCARSDFPCCLISCHSIPLLHESNLWQILRQRIFDASHKRTRNYFHRMDFLLSWNLWKNSQSNISPRHWQRRCGVRVRIKSLPRIPR